MFSFFKKRYTPDISSFGYTETHSKLTVDDYEKFYFAEENISTAIDILVNGCITSGYKLKGNDERKKKIGEEIFFNINDDDTFLDILQDIAYDLLIFNYAFLEERKSKSALKEFEKQVNDPNIRIEDIVQPVKYYHLPAKYMKEWRDENGRLIGFKQVKDSQEVNFKFDELVVFVRGYKTGYLPEPRTIAAKNSVATSIQLTNYTADFFTGHGTPRLHINLENATPEELKKFKLKLEQELKGQPHKNLITNGKIKVEPISVPNKDMEFSTLDDRVQQKLLATYLIPPGLVGKDMRDLATQFFIFKVLALTPFQKIIANKINKRILRKTLKALGLSFEFEALDTVDKKDQATVDAIYLKNQVKSINEIRQEQGLSPVDWGDKPIIPWSDANSAILNPQKAEQNKNEKD